MPLQHLLECVQGCLALLPRLQAQGESQALHEGEEALCLLQSLPAVFFQPVAEEHVPATEEHVPATEVAAPARTEMSPNAIYSQALWDASMGHAISEALVRHIGGFVVHFAGSFHVEKDTGIPERIADYRPGTRVTSVVMTKVDDIDVWSAEEHGRLGDFVVLTKKPPAPAETN